MINKINNNNKYTYGAYLHERDPLGNKYSSGRLLVDAGSPSFPGAAVLAVGGARRGGAGYINYRTRDQLPTELVLRAYPDVVPISEIDPMLFDAILVGPGTPDIHQLPAGRRIIVDGGALTLVSAEPSSPQLRILTPHEGEFRRMGFDPTDRVSAALIAARELHAVVLLKGFHTVVAAPSGVTYIDEIGGTELSTAGTGDVLAGLISSMIASHRPETLEAAAEITGHAVEISSMAAKVAASARKPMVATDLLDAIPTLLAQEGTSL